MKPTIRLDVGSGETTVVNEPNPPVGGLKPTLFTVKAVSLVL